MAHIELPPGLPGIRALLTYRPETARPLNDLVDVLLRGPHTLTPGERELIATYVSAQNDCTYCQSIHGAVAACQLGDADDLVELVKRDPDTAPVSPKLRALLHIAGKTAESGRSVTADDVARAREHGATDREIHDTVLIAAVFCLCNRYVDGLATWTPSDPDFYRQRAKVIVDNGYTLATTTNS
jgi:uncharacterized peroxidase-related enzyme